MLHLENFFEKSFALLLTTPTWDGKTKKQLTQPIAKTYNVERSVSYRESPDSGKRSVLWH